MVDLPTGTVTFLFTDIEGSTRLVKRLGAGYEEVLAQHQRLLRSCFTARRGREIDTQGDSFFVAFARAGDAIECAIDAQRALEGHDWPEGAHVRVRMGLHSGEPRATGERYVGFGVHRAARIGAVGHGGQILVSNATRELVEDDLPPETRFGDLGAYELKDLERPERLFQVEVDGLQQQFPPLKARRVRQQSRARRLSLAFGVLGLAAAAVAVTVYRGGTSEAAVGSAQNPITILTPWEEDDSEDRAFVEVLRAFEQTSGLRTEVLATGSNYQRMLRKRLADGDPPMIAVLPSPGVVGDLARDGVAMPLSVVGIQDDYLTRTYGRTWVDLGTVDGTAYGLPLTAGSKSVFWYRPVDFRTAGLAVPETWEGLLAVTREIRAAGETPWALAAAESWTLTDWFENIYLRTAGPGGYDRLFTGKLRFDDPSVIAALQRMAAILKDPYVAGGIVGAFGTGLGDAISFVFGPDPRAYLYMEGGFVGRLALAFVKPKPKPGQTIASAPFPAIDPALGEPLVVGGDFAVALADHDEVGGLILHLSSPGAAAIWASTGAIVSPHRRVRSTAYPNALVRAEARQITGARLVRFDGSDLLPGALATQFGSALQKVIRRPGDAPQLMKEFQRKAARAFGS
jgi:alpha-glucoside transport system substrate-binding protein